MAQFILDCYPAYVSEFGLLGCAWFTVMAGASTAWVALAVDWLACAVIRRFV